MKENKKIILLFALLVALLPAGILIPRFFHAGDAWGEWSVKSVKEQTGMEPSGMKKSADTYEAPMPDYSVEKDNQSLWASSANYIVSGLVGTGIIFALTFISVKLIAHKPSK